MRLTPMDTTILGISSKPRQKTSSKLLTRIKKQNAIINMNIMVVLQVFFGLFPPVSLSVRTLLQQR